MTKQEDIREGLEKLIPINIMSSSERKSKQYIADRVLKYLHSQGVVIKVDRELPESIASRIPLLKEMLDELGYVAVESLIKE